MANKKAEIKEKYELSAEVYDSRYAEIQKKKFADALEGLTIRDRTLDLGCGTGLLADFLKVPLFGCDISFAMLKKAKKRGVLAVQADLDSLPFKDGAFNSVLSFTALQNLPDVRAVLEEIKRISKHNSTIVITYLKKFDFSNQIRKEFDVLEIKDLGEDEGFVLANK